MDAGASAFLVAYIASRMRALGFEDYTFEPVRIQTATIKASNEFYFLVAKTVPAALKIVADNNAFSEGAAYANFNFYCIQEFTGLIKISTGGAVDLEFVKVIPRLPILHAAQKKTSNALPVKK